MYIYVPMYASIKHIEYKYIYIYICVYIYIHTYTYIYIHVYVCMCIHVCVRMYTCTLCIHHKHPKTHSHACNTKNHNKQIATQHSRGPHCEEHYSSRPPQSHESQGREQICSAQNPTRR